MMATLGGHGAGRCSSCVIATRLAYLEVAVISTEVRTHENRDGGFEHVNRPG